MTHWQVSFTRLGCEPPRPFGNSMTPDYLCVCQHPRSDHVGIKTIAAGSVYTEDSKCRMCGCEGFVRDLVER